jgi:hypothetical protein
MDGICLPIAGEGDRVRRIGGRMSNRKLFSIGILLVVLFMATDSTAAVDEKETIPLNKIWALDMPGTTDIRKLEPNCFGEVLKGKTSAEQVRLQENSLLSQCQRALRNRNDKQTESAFAVRGTGLEALKNARSRLAKTEKPPKSFSPQDAVSIVFFSRLYGASVHIEEVRQWDRHVEIKYRFVPHLEAYLSNNFALIPLKKLSAGKIEVAVVKLPLDQKSKDIGAREVSDEQAARIVCKPFMILVESTK